MKDALNIAIIGGGLIGLSTADSLIRKGARVTIFEKHSETGHGAGRYNSGIIHPSQAAPWFKDEIATKEVQNLVRTAQYSRDLLMERRHQLRCDDIGRASGTVQIFESEQEAQSSLSVSRSLGIICNEYDGDRTFGRHALQFPGDESGSAYHFCQKLTADLIERGCQIKTSAAAKPFRQDQSLYVKAGLNSWSYDRVIIAAGAASPDILESLVRELPVSALRGHALVFDRPNCPLPDIPIMHKASRSAMTVFQDHVRLSGTVNEDDPMALLKIWRDLTPDLIEVLGAPILKWTADRPYSKLGHPIIGPTSMPDLWVNTGHGHMGWSLCTWSGELLARNMLED